MILELLGRRVAALCAMAVVSGAVAAQGVATTQDLSFESVTPRGHFELASAGFPRTPVTITGKLMLPAVPPGTRVPAVVIHHGSVGVLPYYFSRWAQAVVDAGYAAYVIDSYTPRKITSVAVNQDTVSHAADIADAFGALRALAALPMVDPDRIAHVGFSRGGATAIGTTVDAFREAIVGAGGPRFRVAVAHYPGCHYTYHMARPSATPLRIFIGEKDNYTPASHCDAFVRYMRKRGDNVAMQVYPDNHHSYDSDTVLMQVSSFQHFARCSPLVVQMDETPPNPKLLADESRLVAAGTPLPQVIVAIFKWREPCTGRGATVGYNPASDLRQVAVQDTLKVLKEFLGP